MIYGFFSKENYYFPWGLARNNDDILVTMDLEKVKKYFYKKRLSERILTNQRRA